ncbi:MAG: glycosyltransferase, partial [Verrucomicrobiota bacterium]
MKVLVLTSSTGGGHDMRARSFKAWAEKLTSWEVHIHQTLENTHPIYNFGVHTYNWIQKYYPNLHHIYFNYLELIGMHRKASKILGVEAFLKLLDEYRPDLIVSTHAHLNHGFFELARNYRHKDIRFVTICTEFFYGYGFSHHWVNPDVDLFIGGVEETCEAARQLGMPEEKIFCGGFMIRTDFYKRSRTINKRKSFITETLNLDPEKFILLLSTGAVGANNHLKLLSQLKRRHKPIQVVALCGKNRSTYNRLQRWAKKNTMVRVKPLGYIDEMPLLLQSMSAVVTRPGAGTLSECILTQCPLILNGIGGIIGRFRKTYP